MAEKRALTWRFFPRPTLSTARAHIVVDAPPRHAPGKTRKAWLWASNSISVGLLGIGAENEGAAVSGELDVSDLQLGPLATAMTPPNLPDQSNWRRFARQKRQRHEEHAAAARLPVPVAGRPLIQSRAKAATRLCRSPP